MHFLSTRGQNGHDDLLHKTYKLNFQVTSEMVHGFKELSMNKVRLKQLILFVLRSSHQRNFLHKLHLYRLKIKQKVPTG